MPMHDWTRVPDGIFHAFHHRWISAISDALNAGILPEQYYALPEQVAAGFGPDVLTLQSEPANGHPTLEGGSLATEVQARPQTPFIMETDAEFYRRKKSAIAVRHVSDDCVVAMVEIVSPGNKSTRHAFAALVNKACEFLECRVHLLIIDPFPPGPRDPTGVHGAIWQEVQDEPFQLLDDKPLTLVSYECDLTTRAYAEPIAVGDSLPTMALFLEPNRHVNVPLEESYQTAFGVMPRRWAMVLEK